MNLKKFSFSVTLLMPVQIITVLKLVDGTVKQEN